MKLVEEIVYYPRVKVARLWFSPIDWKTVNDVEIVKSSVKDSDVFADDTLVNIKFKNYAICTVTTYPRGKIIKCLEVGNK